MRVSRTLVEYQDQFPDEDIVGRSYAASAGCAVLFVRAAARPGQLLLGEPKARAVPYVSTPELSASQSAGTDHTPWTAYHGVSPKHLQRYVNAFQFRFNQGWHEAELFSPALHAAIAADPFPDRHPPPAVLAAGFTR